jgi:hypothetical protein
MKPRNTRGQGRSPLPATLGPPEDGAKPSSPPVLITQRKLRGRDRSATARLACRRASRMS